MLLRRATPDDARQIFDWRNHPTTRAMSGSQLPLVYGEHCDWFSRFLQAKDRVMWLGIVDGKAVGSVRFDPGEIKGEYIVGIQVDPDRRGQGLGQKMLDMACQKAASELQAQRLIALIRRENAGSAHIFAKAGFVMLEPGGTDSGLSTWHLDRPVFHG